MNDTIEKVVDKVEHVAPPTSFWKKNWKWFAIGGAVVIALALAMCQAKAAPTTYVPMAAEAVSTVHTGFYL
jgi:hypothetical protein